MVRVFLQRVVHAGVERIEVCQVYFKGVHILPEVRQELLTVNELVAGAERPHKLAELAARQRGGQESLHAVSARIRRGVRVRGELLVGGVDIARVPSRVVGHGFENERENFKISAGFSYL